MTDKKVEYIGKGFLGFDPDKTEMTVIEVLTHDLRVDYYGQEMLVRNYEVKRELTARFGR
jgi:hypothetical protein